MGNDITLAQIIDDVMSHLTPLYGQREAQWMVRIILENVKGYSPVDVVLHRPAASPPRNKTSGRP